MGAPYVDAAPVLREPPADPARCLVSLLAVACLLVALAGLAIGAVPIHPGQAISILAAQIGIEFPWTFSDREAAVLLHIRAPRVVLGAVAGAALALGGVLMQALFRNPLADPGLIGVAAGSATAAAAYTVLGPALFPLLVAWPIWGLPSASVLGGLAATALVMRLAKRSGRTRVEHLLLAGIAINALAGAVIGLLMVIADDAQMREVAFWSFGSLGRATWAVIGLAGLLAWPLAAWGYRHAAWLNALLLGEGEAGFLGVPVERK